MIKMKVPVPQAEAILSNIQGRRFEKGMENYWEPCPGNAQSICWLFCWCKAEESDNPYWHRLGIQSQQAFDAIFDKSFHWLDKRLSHEKAKEWRYEQSDIEQEFFSHIK
ncbi:MAG: hypothetical protein F4X91_05875 [Nitrospinae bacterium]|nr:hypothetical protein [Nitrospinota bacterium]